MWNYRNALERIISEYEPGDDIYAPRITISDASLLASQGPEHSELFIENGLFTLERRVIDMRFDRTTREAYKSEEEALFHWLHSFLAGIPKDSFTRMRLNDLAHELSALIPQTE